MGVSWAVLVLHCLCTAAQRPAPLRHYDEARYRYEDELIRGDTFRPRPRGQELEVRVQPLNYRLPAIPTQPPLLAGPAALQLVAEVGGAVVLPCRVANLGAASVSWLRGWPQLTVLSSGPHMFSSSRRLSLLHAEDSPDYNLQISPVRRGDAGQYQCQLNTRPAQSATVELVTRAPGPPSLVPALAQLQADTSAPGGGRGRTEILAPAVVKMTEGGTVTLECVVTEHAAAPQQFVWHILGAPLDFSLHRGGIFLHNERKTRSSSSKLTITKLQVTDSGDYTCAPHGLNNKTVYLDVKQIKQRRSFNFLPAAGGGLVTAACYLLLLAQTVILLL